jgi:hypothetical protein
MTGAEAIIRARINAMIPAQRSAPTVSTARLFRLVRDVDVSGVSGPGIVVEGVVFTDGTAVTHWLVPPSSTAIFRSLDDVVAIHGHDGRTRLEFIDGGGR